MSSAVRGRYAPSPTGFLHLGNARTALVAWWQARAQGSGFVMRIEDLDSQRSRPEFITANIAELDWLGLDWDEGPDIGGAHAPYLQSERQQAYEQTLEKLREAGQIFDCYLSRKDLREVSSAPHRSMLPYGKRQRSLNERLKAQKLAENKAPSLRFRVDKATVDFYDQLQGKQRFELGDFVLLRADKQWAYQLAVVADDIAMGINEVVRGDDLLQSTAAQILLYEALGAKPPSFVHVPLLLSKSGERLAKRKGSLTLTALKEQGVKPERVVGLLAYSLGLNSELTEMTATEGLEHYSLKSLSSEPFSLNSELVNWLLL